MIIRSTDKGKTWSKPVTILDTLMMIVIRHLLSYQMELCFVQCLPTLELIMLIRRIIRPKLQNCNYQSFDNGKT